MASVKKRKKRLPIHIYLIYMIVATLVFTGVTFSSYVSTSEGGDSVTVALFANSTEVILPVSECYPGCEFTIKVKVTNAENGKVCEVSQSYKMHAEVVTGSIPLVLEWIGGQPVGDFHIADGTVERVYDLKVSWPITNGEYPSDDYSEKIEVIRILVDCQQID